MKKIGLLFLLLLPLAGGDKPPNGQAVPKPDETADRVEAGPSGLLDLRFRNVDVFTALEMLSEQAQRNIIVQSGVNGTVSLVLRKVTFDEALRALLAAGGLRFEERDNIIYVMPNQVQGVDAANAVQVPQATRVFRLNFISAAEAEDFIKPLLTQDCHIARTSDGESGGSSVGGASGPTPGSGSKNLSSGSAGGEVLIIMGPPAQLDLINQAITEIDVKPRQVLVEATILRATLNEQNALGIDFSILAGVDFSTIGATSIGGTNLTPGPVPPSQFDNGVSALNTQFTANVPAGGLSFGLITNNVAAFIRALEQVTDVTIMANPKVLTLNKQRAEVIVGRRDGYLTTTVTETSAIQSVQYLETGTKLIFRPYVMRDGHVRMEVHPEDSNGGLTAANLPFQETTETTTNILLKDGHTILIGGLFRERTLSSKSQIPLLGSIPGAGYLFGVTQNATTREEVIILLTVHILKDDEKEQTAFDELVQDVERIRVGARRGLMGSGREQLAEARYQAAVEALRKGKPDEALSQVRFSLQLNPRNLDAIRLREQLLGERTWDADGTRMRSFMQELLRQEAGLDPRRVFDRPDASALLQEDRERLETQSPENDKDGANKPREANQPGGTDKKGGSDK